MSRKTFETWYLRKWGHTEDNHESLFERCPDSPEEYYRLGVRLAHEAWQAATASMQAERDQLAAENVALKESRQRLGQFIHEELEADYPLNMHIETPATDRFLAEQRAQGVESFIGRIEWILREYCNPYVTENIIEDMGKFAAQMRNEVKL